MLAELDRHPHARAVLGSALADGQPSHAYLFHGPGGAGKRAAATALAAELLADGSDRADDARARVLSGAHPDLTWVAPSGAHEMLVSDIDLPVIAAASKTPFESSRRVFVIERVDELGDEAANRMLKTLEEPASFVHLILLTDRLVEVLPTIRSRCQRLELRPLDAQAMDQELKTLLPELKADERASLARLSGGSPGMALTLADGEGIGLAAEADRLIERAADPDIPALIAFAERIGRVTDGLEDFGAIVAQSLAERIATRASAGMRVDRWIGAREQLMRSFARSTALHLDPRQTVLGAARILSGAARRAGAI